MDRTGELESRLAELDARHDDRMREFMLEFGRACGALGRRRGTRWLLENVLSRLAAWYVVERIHRDNEKARSGDLLDIVEAWLELPILFRPPFRVVEAGRDRVVIAWDTCPLGFTGDMLATCRASTAIDVRTVKRLGANLEVARSILEGAPDCLFVITRR